MYSVRAVRTDQSKPVGFASPGYRTRPLSATQRASAQSLNRGERSEVVGDAQSNSNSSSSRTTTTGGATVTHSTRLTPSKYQPSIQPRVKISASGHVVGGKGKPSPIAALHAAASSSTTIKAAIPRIFAQFAPTNAMGNIKPLQSSGNQTTSSHPEAKTMRPQSAPTKRPQSHAATPRSRVSMVDRFRSHILPQTREENPNTKCPQRPRSAHVSTTQGGTRRRGGSVLMKPTTPFSHGGQPQVPNISLGQLHKEQVVHNPDAFIAPDPDEHFPVDSISPVVSARRPGGRYELDIVAMEAKTPVTDHIELRNFVSLLERCFLAFKFSQAIHHKSNNTSGGVVGGLAAAPASRLILARSYLLLDRFGEASEQYSSILAHLDLYRMETQGARMMKTSESDACQALTELVEAERRGVNLAQRLVGELKVAKFVSAAELLKTLTVTFSLAGPPRTANDGRVGTPRSAVGSRKNVSSGKEISSSLDQLLQDCPPSFGFSTMSSKQLYDLSVPCCVTMRSLQAEVFLHLGNIDLAWNSLKNIFPTSAPIIRGGDCVIPPSPAATNGQAAERGESEVNSPSADVILACAHIRAATGDYSGAAKLSTIGVNLFAEQRSVFGKRNFSMIEDQQLPSFTPSDCESIGQEDLRPSQPEMRHPKITRAHFRSLLSRHELFCSRLGEVSQIAVACKFQLNLERKTPGRITSAQISTAIPQLSRLLDSLLASTTFLHVPSPSTLLGTKAEKPILQIVRGILYLGQAKCSLVMAEEEEGGVRKERIAAVDTYLAKATASLSSTSSFEGASITSSNDDERYHFAIQHLAHVEQCLLQARVKLLSKNVLGAQASATALISAGEKLDEQLYSGDASNSLRYNLPYRVLKSLLCEQLLRTVGGEGRSSSSSGSSSSSSVTSLVGRNILFESQRISSSSSSSFTVEETYSPATNGNSASAEHQNGQDHERNDGDGDHDDDVDDAIDERRQQQEAWEREVGELDKLTYYQLLGVHIKSTTKDIRSAYKSKALLWHPDKWMGAVNNTPPTSTCSRRTRRGSQMETPTMGKKKILIDLAERRFKLLHEAFKVLSDPPKRVKYDCELLVKKK